MNTQLILFKPTRCFRLLFTLDSPIINKVVLSNYFNQVHAIEDFTAYFNEICAGTYATLNIVSCNEYNAK